MTIIKRSQKKWVSICTYKQIHICECMHTSTDFCILIHPHVYICINATAITSCWSNKILFLFNYFYLFASAKSLINLQFDYLNKPILYFGPNNYFFHSLHTCACVYTHIQKRQKEKYNFILRFYENYLLHQFKTNQSIYYKSEGF